MNKRVTDTLVGDPVDAPSNTQPPKTRAERIQDWKNENQAAYEVARREICNCAPTRAQMLLADQFEGRCNCPVD
jgi:hypothetical protein